MQTLVFNTTTKTVTLYSSSRMNGSIIETFYSVPTVKIEGNYYQVMQEIEERVPVMRVPVSNTNMIIEK
jgi:hypothetical protein